MKCDTTKTVNVFENRDKGSIPCPSCFEDYHDITPELEKVFVECGCGFVGNILVVPWEMIKTNLFAPENIDAIVRDGEVCFFRYQLGSLTSMVAAHRDDAYSLYMSCIELEIGMKIEVNSTDSWVIWILPESNNLFHVTWVGEQLEVADV